MFEHFEYYDNGTDAAFRTHALREGGYRASAREWTAGEWRVTYYD